MNCFIQSILLVLILFLSFFFFLFLAFICCLEKPCLEAGISTLVLQLYKGYLTSVSIQGSIYLSLHFSIGCAREFLQHLSEVWCDSKNISSTMECFAVLSTSYA